MAERALAHGGDAIAAALAAHGVGFVFTLCGGHISPVLTAAHARGLRVIDVRHEATAVFAADAVSRLTGLPGVAAVTAGPGLTNSITALKNAQLAQSAAVLLGGAAPTLLQGRGALQDIDQGPLIAPHVKWFAKLRRVRDLAPAVGRAFATARRGVPGPVCLECPVDLLYEEATVRQWYADAGGKSGALAARLRRAYLQRHVEALFAGGAAKPVTPEAVVPPRPGETSVRAAVAALRAAERPLAVIGSQALVRATEARQIAAAVERAGIPVYLSGMARGLLGREHPLHFRHQRREALREADCVLLAGVPCDFRLDYGRHVRRGATLIAANRSAGDARLNRRPDIAAIGDAGLFLEALGETLAGAGARPRPWLDPGVFGTLGVGAGFALGAALCRPDREIWILYGDGAAGYSLMEFDSFVRHGIPVIAVVGNDGCWSQIAREQVHLLQDDVATALRRSDYHLAAAALGGEGILVTRTAEAPAAIARAREAARAGRPVLLNVWLDKTDFREGSVSM